MLKMKKNDEQNIYEIFFQKKDFQKKNKLRKKRFSGKKRFWTKFSVMDVNVKNGSSVPMFPYIYIQHQSFQRAPLSLLSVFIWRASMRRVLRRGWPALSSGVDRVDALRLMACVCVRNVQRCRRRRDVEGDLVFAVRLPTTTKRAQTSECTLDSIQSSN